MEMWPPPYKVRKHAQAKHVKLRASALHGIEITIPVRFSLKHIPEVLEKNREWILKQLSKLPAVDHALPDRIALFTGTWQIIYMATDQPIKIIQRPDQELVVLGKVKDPLICKKKLQAWVRNKAHATLIPLLVKLSAETQLPFADVSIRAQRSVWGTCNVRKIISLNYKLMFLPYEVVRYVLIHELCHTKYLNHSTDFWKLVTTFDPTWRAQKRILRLADQYVPGWV